MYASAHTHTVIDIYIYYTCIPFLRPVTVYGDVGCCSVLQCLQFVAVCQCVAVCRSVLQCVAVSFRRMQCVAVCFRVLQCVAVCIFLCALSQCMALTNVHSDLTNWKINKCFPSSVLPQCFDVEPKVDLVHNDLYWTGSSQGFCYTFGGPQPERA